MTNGASDRGVAHDTVRSMLEARAERLRPAPLDVPALIADVPQAAIRPGWFGTLAPRLSVAVAAAAMVLVTSALVVGPLAVQPAGSQVPSASSAAVTSPGASTGAPEAVRMLIAPELGDLARTRSAELDARLAAVRGTLTVLLDPRCSGAACATVTLEGAGEGFALRLGPDFVGDVGTDGSGTTNGAYVVRFSAERNHDRPVVVVLGRLINERAEGFTSSVRQLVAEDPGRPGSYAAIDGWLVRSPLRLCPLTVSPTDTPTYDCPSADYLTDEEFQPARRGGGAMRPERGISLPTGSYTTWAPDPMTIADSGVAPRRAVYLLQRQQDSACPGYGAGCGLQVSRWGVITGRLDPIPPYPSESPAVSLAPDPSPISATSGDPWTVADLLGTRHESNAEYLVRGWLVATPPLRCLAPPLPSGLPDYGCDEVDWLTDEAFQPWVTTAQVAGIRAPDVGMRVQNGAYAAFAPSPGFGEPGGGREPRFGIWLVRFAVYSTCDYGALDPGVACAGGPLFTWEVIRRL